MCVELTCLLQLITAFRCRVQLTLVVVDGAKRIDQRVAENLAALFEHALRCKHEIVIVINKVSFLANSVVSMMLKSAVTCIADNNHAMPLCCLQVNKQMWPS
jgi:signal recognition particle receptor subunit beta